MYKESPKENNFGFLRASNSIHKLLDKNLYRYSGETITHYTDLLGLHGIIESKGFWLSDHRFLNDSKEFENGRVLTETLLEKLSQKYRYQNFSHILIDAIKYINQYKEQAHYICSFSKYSNNLDQWRSYANNGKGISITFNNKQGLSHFNIIPIMNIFEVIYNYKEQSKILISIIRKYNDEYMSDIKHGNPINLFTWVEQMSLDLIYFFLNFKHSEFESEKEVRIVTRHSKLSEFKDLKHRVSQNCIIPYLNSNDLYCEKVYEYIGDDRLPIKEIHIGPAANQEITKRSIEGYLLSKGYDQVKILKSEIPYRG